MKAEVDEVERSRAEPEHLVVQHQAPPGERMPVVGVELGKGSQRASGSSPRRTSSESTTYCGSSSSTKSKSAT